MNSNAGSYIQSNQVQPVAERSEATAVAVQSREATRPKDPRIAAHERARAIMSRLYDLRLELRTQNLTSSEIDAKLAEEKKRLESIRGAFTTDLGLDY